VGTWAGEDGGDPDEADLALVLELGALLQGACSWYSSGVRLRWNCTRSRWSASTLELLVSVIGTLQRECLDRVLVLGRRHLEAVLSECVAHYNSYRPHRSLSQRSPSALDMTPAHIGDVDLARLRRSDPLGGCIHEYRMVTRAGGRVHGTDMVESKTKMTKSQK
jgi:hypothetical protein